MSAAQSLHITLTQLRLCKTWERFKKVRKNTYGRVGWSKLTMGRADRREALSSLEKVLLTEDHCLWETFDLGFGWYAHSFAGRSDDELDSRPVYVLQAVFAQAWKDERAQQDEHTSRGTVKSNEADTSDLPPPYSE